MLHSSASASPISMVLGAGAVILRSPARTVSFVSVGRSQSQDDIPAVLAGDLEPALLEHPDRSDVVSGDIGVEGASLLEVQQLRERPCGDAPAPVFLADPVADLPFAGVHEAHDVAGHLPLVEDRLLHNGLVAQDSVPVRQERYLVPCGKISHAGRFRVELVFEEYGEVAFRHVPQHDIVLRRVPCASGYVILPGPCRADRYSIGPPIRISLRSSLSVAWPRAACRRGRG